MGICKSCLFNPPFHWRAFGVGSMLMRQDWTATIGTDQTAHQRTGRDDASLLPPNLLHAEANLDYESGCRFTTRDKCDAPAIHRH